MARLEAAEHTYLTTTRGLCRSCRRVVPARVFLREGKVWQESLCERCPGQPALIAGDARWYLENALGPFPDRAPLAGARPPVRGCPQDCGPCTWHASRCQLPVVSITNACNLECPICFTYNRQDRLYFMAPDELRALVDGLVESSGPLDLINLTGGEPTLHPGLLELVEVCQRPEIGRVTVNTNGVRVARDRELCERLAELGVCVVLSFPTFDPRVSEQLHGRDLVPTKLAALENLTRAGVRVTLLQVLVRDLNERDLEGLLDLLRAEERILSLTVQTMTYTGQGGSRFPGRRHLPVDDATRAVCAGSRGDLRFEDFLPRPAAHPLCYSLCYLLRSGTRLLPFARFAPRERLAELLGESYLMRLAGREDLFRDAIADLYARGAAEDLRVFRALVEELFPSGTRAPLDEFSRQRRAEAAVRTIYVHAHMDEDTFDCSRAALCPDLVPTEPGRLVPACTYNLLYRMRDERFWPTG